VPRVSALLIEPAKLGAKVGDHAFARYLERYSLPRFSRRFAPLPHKRHWFSPRLTGLPLAALSIEGSITALLENQRSSVKIARMRSRDGATAAETQ